MHEMEQSNNERAQQMSGSNMSESKYRVVVLTLFISLICVMFAAICIGRYGIGIGDCLKILVSKVVDITQTWTKTMANVVWIVRMPRILAAALVGAGLAIAGAAYQSMFKNPMVSPDILGVSSGAAIGACSAILFGLGTVYIQSWAFIGGMVAVFITAFIPRLMKNTSPIILVLAGIITGSLMNSVLGIIRYIAASSANDTVLADITYWTMGSFTKASMSNLAIIAPLVIIAGGILMLVRYRLNVLSLGDNEAKSLGVNVGRTQLVIIITATLITASCVSLCGTIGWVGLVVPHLGRMIVGPDNRKMLPVTMFLGALFMVVIDTICRTISAAEIPVSIVTGIIGAPFYFYLLYKQRMNM